MDQRLISKHFSRPREPGVSGLRLDSRRDSQNKATLHRNGKMPLSAHMETGRLLKEVYAATYYRKSVYNRVNIARSTLDDWAMNEYPDQKALPNDEFFKLYYRGPPHTFRRHISSEERTQHIDRLRRAQEIVQAHYPASARLRSLLKLLDGAIRSLQSWT